MTGPILHRDDPNAKPLVGNIKVTRQDWLNQAMNTLVSDGVEQVKVLTLAERMGVSRSSFYWYFKSRQDLLDALLSEWQATNTAAVIERSAAPAGTITAAVLNVWHCVANPELFNTALDFAIRDWARRVAKVRRALDLSDARRLQALTEMFSRFGYPEAEAGSRARALYFMQIGYDLADLGETMEARLARVEDYLLIFTGKRPLPGEVDSFAEYARHHWQEGDRS